VPHELPPAAVPRISCRTQQRPQLAARIKLQHCTSSTATTTTTLAIVDAMSDN
jgi:hypothetical protein